MSNHETARTRQPRVDDPGDVGRHVARRREELGLTREETAARAQMDPHYIEYLETTAVPVDLSALMRLAHALQTSVGALLGGENLAPGSATAAERPSLAQLTPDECWARVSARGVGRVVLVTPEGPAALPVNYRIVDRTVIFRTGEEGVLAHAVGHEVGFEVDRIDDGRSSGWSVLGIGVAERITDPEQLAGLAERMQPTPWAGGDRPVWVSIRPSRLSGREVRTGEPDPVPRSRGGTR
ncbi:helix-turn-helix domain-containing protein [Streptacidiphilus neutrinimicus]|uniref:helix-turn-helix domain-containing protein n=1 Tax=Streptacidiphilus neutrinimicus TaxID=105420 RepID=UPI0005A818AA|nr:pyridoxamine 5'-phosphate oxidase family protein [Streptacidiphilus neutrinimicus]